jgi:hypothetical protein
VADQIFPTSVRIAHYVTSGPKATQWGKPFRVLDNDLHWLVPLGEAHGTCSYLEFEDVIPPDNYGGLESPLGTMGYSPMYRCYGIQLTLRAELESADQRTSRPFAATKRAIIQCGRFHRS